MDILFEAVMRSSFVLSQFLIRKFTDLGLGSVNLSHFSQLYTMLLLKFCLYICLVILLVILHQKEWQTLLQLSPYRGACQVPRAVRILMPYSTQKTYHGIIKRPCHGTTRHKCPVAFYLYPYRKSLMRIKAKCLG